MPKQKDFKRLVRARMEKTGESYTAARARVLAKADASFSARHATPHPDEYPDIAGMSDDAVRRRTGRDWREWVEVLDAAGATEMAHRDVASMLHETHAVPAWWAQMVTVGYERIRGLRAKGQRRDGTFDVNKSKTLPVPVERLYTAFADERLRRRWLPDAEVTVRTSKRDKSIRFTWDDGLPVQAYFSAKGDEKSAVSVQHGKLSSRADADARRRYWTEKLEALSAELC